MTSASAARRLFAARQRFKRANTLWSKGFTLIEVVIVAAIAGILGATAIPQFLSVKDRAEAKAKTSEAVGIAKECASLMIDGRSDATVILPGTTTQTTCNGSATVTIASEAWTNSADVDCAGTAVTGATSVSLEVSTTGVIDCS